VGNLSTAEDEEFFRSAGISHVLTAAGRLKVTLPPVAGLKVRRFCLQLADHPTAILLAELPEALAFCDAALGLGCHRESSEDQAPNGDGALLVHCASGVSRSVSVCVALLMTRVNMTYQEALAAIRSTRPQACPNIGFEQQLFILETKGGDVNEAVESWSAQHLKADVIQVAQKQREAANDMHVKLDTLEHELAAARSAGLTESHSQDFIRQLH